jgi:hypothetical protein
LYCISDAITMGPSFGLWLQTSSSAERDQASTCSASSRRHWASWPEMDRERLHVPAVHHFAIVVPVVGYRRTAPPSGRLCAAFEVMSPAHRQFWVKQFRLYLRCAGVSVSCQVVAIAWQLGQEMGSRI